MGMSEGIYERVDEIQSDKKNAIRKAYHKIREKGKIRKTVYKRNIFLKMRNNINTKKKKNILNDLLGYKTFLHFQNFIILRAFLTDTNTPLLKTLHHKVVQSCKSVYRNDKVNPSIVLQFHTYETIP